MYGSVDVPCGAPEQTLSKIHWRASVLKVEEHGLLGKKVEGDGYTSTALWSPGIALTSFSLLPSRSSFLEWVFISFCFILEVGILILQ